MRTRFALLATFLVLALPAPAFGAVAAGSVGALPVFATAVPAGFRAVSVTFASPSEGWVLGTVACGSARCLAVAHTLNAGHTWSALPAPAASVSHVSAIRFADSHNGWAYGPDLWATHDGGHTWHETAVPGFAGDMVLALEAGAGTAHLVLYDGASTFRIASTAVAHDAWSVVSTHLAVGAGPVPEIQLVLAATSGWILQNDRTVVNGARIIHGVWHTWNPACGNVVGPAVIAASSASNMVAICDVGLWGMPTGEHLYASHNGGFSFVPTGPSVPVHSVQVVASPTSSTIVTAGLVGSSTRLIASFNGGLAWTTVGSLGSANADQLGFTTTLQGVLVTSSGRLWMTRNGGHSWANVAF